MARRKQTEIDYAADEAPAKMYHFREVKDQLDRMENGLSEVTKKLELQANTQVPMKYLEDRLVAITGSFTDKMNSEFKDRDNRMDTFEKIADQMRKDMKKFTWATITTGLTIIAAAVAVILFTSTKS